MEKEPWLTHYPESLLQKIDFSAYSSLVHMIEETFSKYRDLPMCENMGKILTFDAVDKLSKSFAAYIQQYTNLEIGTHVAIQLPNLLQYPIVVFGLLRAGLVVVNINPQYTPHEMAYQLKDAGVRAIVVLENFAYKLAKILPETSIQTIIITKVGDMLGSVKGRLLNFAIKHIKKLIPTYDLPQAISFKQTLEIGRKAIFSPVSLQSSDIAFLQYTGGTTGVSKAAILSHGNITANLQQLEPVMRLRLKERVERTIIPLPFYHILGLGSLFAMAKIGAKSLLITNPRDIPRFVKELKKNKPTCLIGLNTLFEKLLTNEQFRKLDFSTMKLTVAGGMSTQAIVKEQWEGLTGSKLVEGYGLTECSPGVSTDMINGVNHIPFPETSVIIANEEGDALPYGVAGELLVKGPQVTQSYWQKPMETEQAFINGWFRTGDIAIMDANGFISIVDRKKDMINVSGFNVYPNEIEHVLIGHPKVLEVGAIGVEDITLKEAIKVFIVKKDATLTAEEIINYCKEKMTRYKIPKYIEFRNSLPKSPIGKVLRKLLKE
ncbi:AMP-binding protein [Cardinium endosymbiont of Culicoides punctatus]|uniref:AMP-binding protein n=1 Tax=Cardinium endosymbiont of Culicoides punctatus TaxID=2304601 RepID=UPI001058F9EA|nr:AMP-binding protein [Cardinium endosymbiont of Culicoides punctatus]TDG95486.1 Long-chain-fatty-acid--CoA ligase [Cardinium endosymbiont of Culicoides punctatus]